MANIKSRMLAQLPRFSYLPDSDRFLSKRESPQFSINVIGAGINGQEHMRVTEFEERGTIHGVYDPNPGSIRAAKKIMNELGKDLVVYKDLVSACTDPAVDALIISTPNYTHREVLDVAIQSGKHILLEKPMATTIKDAYHIMKLSEQYEAVFQIGLQYRYKSIYRESVHEALERKSLGEIKQISIQEHRIPFLDKVGQWNKFSEFSGGTLVEKCCHYFDLFNLFAQAKPVRVYATGEQSVNFKDFEKDGNKSDIIDQAFVIVEYANGVKANFNLCMFAPLFYEELVLCGTNGRLKANEKNDFISQKGLECSMEMNFGEDLPSRYIIPHYPKHIEDAGHHGATFFEHVNFIDNILGKETNAAVVAEGFWSVVVGAAAEESIKQQRPILIDELLSQNGINL
ncbi:MAG: Gfo/Idh/MocA family oxidoreductase [Bacteroidetes bacterium]|nr:Gfo/Idh/MocA family oxidoreductase [Bacteroidota bacterium]